MDAKIEGLSTERNNYGNLIFVCDGMLNIQKYLIVIGSLICLLCGGFKDINNFFVSALINGISGVLGISIAVATTMLYFGIAKIVCTKKFKKLETEILITEDLRRDYVVELSKLNEKDKSNVISNENTIYVENYNKQLNEMIDNKMAELNKPKKLTLKKRK